MTPAFLILTILFIVVSAAMILIVLVQRSQGGGLAGAFGGAGGGTDTVFGGRVGDALTWATVGAFVAYLLIAVALNKVSLTVATEDLAEQPGLTGTTEAVEEPFDPANPAANAPTFDPNETDG